MNSFALVGAAMPKEVLSGSVLGSYSVVFLLACGAASLVMAVYFLFKAPRFHGLHYGQQTEE